VKRERSPPHRVEVQRGNPPNFFVSVTIENEVEDLASTRPGGSNKARRQERAQVVSTLPLDRACRIVPRLEIEPVCDAGVEINEYVVGHRIGVRNAGAMERRERDNGMLDRFRAEPLCDPRVLQQRRKRPSGEHRQKEYAIAGDCNRLPIHARVNAPLVFLPIALRQHSHASIESPHQPIAHPDE
jgi:hypothetical protein